MAFSVSSSAYRYVPLPDPSTHIRLLEVQPCSDTTDRLRTSIECTTRISKLEDAPEYHALSYMWSQTEEGGELEGANLEHSEDTTVYGEQNNSNHRENTRIYLDGREKCITRNLASFLFQLRRSAELITLWADAICIDQDSDIERTQQVAIMGRIYSSAISVYAWLGPAADQSDGVIDLLNRLNDHNLLNLEGRNEVVAQFYEHGLAESLFKLCGRPYWRRIWIIQEVALARDVMFHCGTRKIACSILDEVCSGWSLQTSGDSAWRDWSVLKDKFIDQSVDWVGRSLMRLPEPTISWLNIKRGTLVAGREELGPAERPFEICGECEIGPHFTFSRTVDSLAWSLEVITFRNLEYMEKYGLLKFDPDDDTRNLIIESTEGHATFVKGKVLNFNPEHFQAKTAYTAIQVFWSGLRQTLAGTVLHARSEQRSQNLAELIAQYERWQCSDARDHVYAILSMATDYQRAFLSPGTSILQLRPDYTWSRVRLFFETIRFCEDEQDAIGLGRILTKILDIGMEACRDDEDTLVEQFASCILKQDIALTVPVVVKKSDFLLSDLQPRRIKTSIDHLAYVYALASSRWTGPNRMLRSIPLNNGMDEIYARVAEPPYYVIPDKLCILSEDPAAFDVVFHLESAEVFLIARPTSNEGIYTSSSF
ncbi:heterokaryon incompatibility protein-domain-containing protein [Xylaria sp. FL0064]|nr:heterokaryon incompatibility protein-domain-containing protein [Xylaria sp. FL0064]